MKKYVFRLYDNIKNKAIMTLNIWFEYNFKIKIIEKKFKVKNNLLFYLQKSLKF